MHSDRQISLCCRVNRHSETILILKPGFNPGIDEQLYREAKTDSIPEFQRYVCLVSDEIEVKEDLVYGKHSASLLGFVKIGDVNDHLSKLEENASSNTPKPNLATHVLIFMVSGILSNLEFPYVSFLVHQYLVINYTR